MHRSIVTGALAITYIHWSSLACASQAIPKGLPSRPGRETSAEWNSLAFKEGSVSLLQLSPLGFSPARNSVSMSNLIGLFGGKTQDPDEVKEVPKTPKLGESSVSEPIKAEINNRVENVIDKEVQKAASEHRQPTKEELNIAVEDELDRIWWTLMRAHRHQWHPGADRPTGILNFFESVEFFDWCLLFIAFVGFLLLYRYLLDWPSTKAYHSLTLLLWLSAGLVYNCLIFWRLGEKAGYMWANGYVLEFIFLIENVFVFHIIVKAFRMPRQVTQKVLFIVVNLQILFQMIFYMGLAAWLRSFEALPYILGVWLVYIGFQAATEDDHGDFDIMQTPVVVWLRYLLGERLVLDTANLDSDNVCSVFAMHESSGKYGISRAGLMTLCILLADFLLEIDVTLTKIETFPNQYICFSSSMLASFAVPELFFVARDIFQKYHGLKYGISFVLVFFGLQMLLHNVFTLPALVCIGILVLVMLLSVVLSIAFDMGKGNIGTEPMNYED